MLMFHFFNTMQFEAGHRSCLGKNISLLEIYKVVPTLLRRFNVSNHSIEAIPEGGLVHRADWE